MSSASHSARAARIRGIVVVVVVVAVCVTMLGAGVAAHASPQAPTLSASQSCLTPGDQLDLTGSGYTPNGVVDLDIVIVGAHAHKSGAFASLIADANGALPKGTHFSLDALASKKDIQETVTLTASDQTRIKAGVPRGPATSAMVKLTDTTPEFDVPPWDDEHVNRVDPRKRATFTARGLEPAKQLYLSYVLRHKLIKRVRMGALSGPCGNLRRTMRQFPFRPVPAGSYSVYLSFSKFGRRVLTYSQLRVTSARAVR